jgi:DNA primase
VKFNRGLSDETINDFEIGYCRKNNDSAIYRFSDRVIFPIFNASCDLVAFGGRALDGSPDKYINSPDSPIYCKSKILYNLDKAQDYILNTGNAIVVEGYFDVAALWEYGIRNVVATCGTAMTRYQLRLLKRYADSVSICYDGDSAGAKAAARAAEGLAALIE